MNVQSIRKMYELLNHSSFWSRVGSLDTNTKQYENRFVHGLDAVIDYASKWDSKRNVFISRNPRNKNGDVINSNCITFDIDPIKESGKAATNEQHINAINAGQKLLEIYPNGSLCSSGNGCLLLYSCVIGRDILADYYKKEKVFIQQLNDLVKEYGCLVDETSYEEAMLKLIGTVSTKGNSEDQRLSRFITKGSANNEIYKEVQRIVVNTMVGSQEKFEGDPIKRLKEAQECLERIQGVEDYTRWLSVGMALKEFGIAGLSLWKEWSKKGTNYEEGICEEKWPTLNENPEITLGSLKYWSKGSETTSTNSQSISLSGDRYFDNLFSKDSGFEQPILTGISGIDTCLRGLPKGEITTIAARSGFGKTSFACTISEFLRKQNKRILYFSTEMSVEYIMHKFVSIACNIPTKKLIEKNLFDIDKTNIGIYKLDFERFPIIICDEFSPKLELVKDLVEQQKPDIVVFDHATQSGTHWEIQAQFLRGLKELVREYSIPAFLPLMLDEPPRDSKGNIGVSVRGDIRGTKEALHLSAIFMLMNNLYEVKGDIQPVQLEICKNRFGVSGTELEIHVDKNTGRYTD